MAYMRKVRTASGAMAVQIVWSSRCGPRQIDRLGWAHDEGEVAALTVVAAERIVAGQQVLDLGLAAAAGAGRWRFVGSRAGHLWDAPGRAYGFLGFEEATRSLDIPTIYAYGYLGYEQ